jgi:hypothetical protein
MAVGRQDIVTPRGPEKVTFSPASAASWQMNTSPTNRLQGPIDWS